ncbi:YciI family protein [Sphingopyxis sp.]|uniref:YciI family protein n=1 Tax=Sphingopyxis sp. TaxID=1908224 RepID=UPI003D6D8009
MTRAPIRFALLLSLAAPALPAAAQTGAAQTAATHPDTAPQSATAPAAQPLFALILAPGPAWKPGKPFAEQGLRPHFDYWMALFRQGRVASAGPVGADGGLVLLRAADQAAADAILAADPAIVAGIFTGTVRRYAPPMVNANALAAPRE